MSAPSHSHDDMWRTPMPATPKAEDDDAEQPKRGRVLDERAVEDSWYQVLRRKHVEDADED